MKTKLFVFFMVFFVVAGCDWLSKPSGVLLDRHITPEIKTYIYANVSNQLAQEGVIAYYDTTISLDNSESYILTNKSLTIFCDGFLGDGYVGTFDCLGTVPHGTNKIYLDDIVAVYESNETYDGSSCASNFQELCVTVQTNNKDYFLMFAYYNNGPLFLSRLKEALYSF
ncbi:MAG: hypothetical protein CMD58_02795 [Gammaproteobacteria bacterium]|nr:hypothetical protein [Gammaproteobacteria bacterium]